MKIEFAILGRSCQPTIKARSDEGRVAYVWRLPYNFASLFDKQVAVRRRRNAFVGLGGVLFIAGAAALSTSLPIN
jgi:hypothetical protein